MKIKSKQFFFVGAFIVLILIGYIILPRDEILIDISNNEDVSQLGKVLLSGDLENIKTIYVHIEGAVNSPGIKEVPEKTRLFELIEFADGEVADADLSKLNLASILKDEQKIYVPYKTLENDALIKSENDVKTNIIFNTTLTYDELININTANIEVLQKLEGIGPTMAEKIIDYREENGHFSSIEDIKNVSGIGESKYNKIKDNITI